jgi:hypothetical protein
MEVLKYAIKHGYADIADEAAFGSLGCKADEMAKRLSLEATNAWVCCSFLPGSEMRLMVMGT